jgi:hypothetical protein
VVVPGHPALYATGPQFCAPFGAPLLPPAAFHNSNNMLMPAVPAFPFDPMMPAAAPAFPQTQELPRIVTPGTENDVEQRERDAALKEWELRNKATRRYR